MIQYLEPTRVVTYENCEGAENLLKGNPAQAGFNDRNCVKIRQGGYVLLDFGKEINGSLSITTQRTSIVRASARLVFGESVMEALSSIGEKNATNDHSVRDMVVELGMMSTMRFGEMGFRFAKVEALEGDLTIKAIKAIPVIPDVPQVGKFECSDERLNEIWRVGAYTVQLNMQHGYIWDGIKRDRLVWIGDMHPEVSTLRMVFGQDGAVPASLDFVKDETPGDQWMNTIASYSLWWIMIHHDWYMHWGDLAYLQEQRDYMKQVVDHAVQVLDTGIKETGMGCFVDWSTKDTPDELDGVKAVFCMGLARAARIFDVLGEEEYACKCRNYVSQLQAEKAERALSKRMSALTILAGRDSSFAIPVVSDDSAKEMSCFMGYYVLLAKAALAQYEGALKVIREYWGAMLDLGATTFWEDFDIDWVPGAARIDEITPEGMKDIHGDFGRFCYQQFRHSLCHGWASGPTPFLMEKIGGIEILEPGCKKLRVAPNPAGLDWFKVEYPTPYGNVKVAYSKETGVSVEAPEGVEIVIE